MDNPILSISGIKRFLQDRIAGLAAVVALAVPGIAAGAALAKALFSGKAADWGAALSGGTVSLHAVAALCAGVLPALLFGTTMLVCSFSPFLLPVWGAAVLFYWMADGMALAILSVLCQAGAALAAHATILPGLLLTMPLYLLLALQAVGRVGHPGDPFGFDDVAGEVLSTVIPAVAAAAVQTASVTLGCILLNGMAAG